MTTAQTQELKDRVLAKRKELEAELHRLRASASEETREKAKALEDKIGEVDKAIRDGFESLKSDSIEQLNRWLKKADTH